MTTWPKTKLGDHLDVLTGFPFKSKGYSSHQDDTLLLRGDNIGQGSIRWKDAKRWPQQHDASLDKFALRAGDVVLAMDRPWIEAGLKWGVVSRDEGPALLVQRVARLRAASGLCQAFIPCVVGSYAFSAYIKSSTSGTNVPHISVADIKNYSLRLPPIHTQRRIAAVLLAYDDLIGNSLRRIRVLEEMAQALFLRASSQSVSPKAKVVRLGDIAYFVKEVMSPQDEPDAIFDLYSFAACDEGRLPHPTRGSSIQSNKFRVPSSVVLLPKLNPHIPRTWVPFLEGDRSAICSTEFLPLVPRGALPRSFVYALVECNEFQRAISVRADGTSNSHKRLQPDDVMNQSVTLPDTAVVQQFAALADPIYEQCHVLRKRNRTLRAARDLLLPRLLSGELDVSRVPDPAELTPESPP